MVRRDAAEFPSLPSEIAAAARRAANAQRTLAQALAPTADEVDHYVEYMTLLCEADEASALAERSIRQARNATELLRGCFERAGVSSWTPSYSLVSAGFVK